MTLWQVPSDTRLKGKRDRALLALLLACGLRRHEAVSLEMRQVQQREEHRAIVDLRGKAGHTRTVPVPDWVKDLLDRWPQAASISTGRIFRRVTKAGTVWGTGMTEKVVWHVVREYAPAAPASRPWPRTIFGGAVRVCATRQEASWIRFSSYLATCLSKPPSAISAASSESMLP